MSTFNDLVSSSQIKDIVDTVTSRTKSLFVSKSTYTSKISELESTISDLTSRVEDLENNSKLEDETTEPDDNDSDPVDNNN